MFRNGQFEKHWLNIGGWLEVGVIFCRHRLVLKTCFLKVTNSGSTQGSSVRGWQGGSEASVLTHNCNVVGSVPDGVRCLAQNTVKIIVFPMHFILKNIDFRSILS